VSGEARHPRVTVVMPARNAGDYVEDAVASVLAQQFRDWELIVVDDGSTDQTASLARAADRRVNVIENPDPSGPAGARNLAIRRARGELVALLDADDRWLPAYLERQVALFDAEQAVDGRVGIVACDATVIEDGEPRPEPYSAVAGGSADGIGLETLLRFNPIFISALAPRRVVLEAGGFEPTAFGSADLDLWIRIVELGYRVVASSERLVQYRKHSAGISRDSVAMARDSELAYHRALERGRLTPQQRRIAHRSLRLQRSVRELEQFLAYPSKRAAPASAWLGAAHGAFGLALHALSSPSRWPEWARAARRRGWALWRPKWDA
jgi:glycosyltransferase involved in cell wall biosynthesis